MDKVKKTRKKLRFWQWLLIIAAAAIAAVALRYAYMFFIDPMSAFSDQLATPSPVQSETVLTPLPADTEPPATPVPTTAAATSAPTASPVPTAEPTVAPTPTATPKLDLAFMKNRVNILIVGWDESPERNDETSEVYRDEGNNFRSDVIMLLTVDFDTGRVDLISVPRDTLAPIYKDNGERLSETAHWKINAAFAKGGSAAGSGFEYAMTTVSKLFGGIPIQYYAGVNMQGMKAVVDAMGGVDYDVDVRIELNGRVLEKGYQHLEGQQVLDYCRARKGISTDVGRTDRQQRMLFAIFNQLKSRDQLKNFINVYNSVKGYIYTNLNSDQIATMASFAAGLDTEDLHRKTLEGDYVSSTAYNGASFYCLYNDKLTELVDKVFGITITPDPTQDIAYVLGDKAAKIGREYVAGARYILSFTETYLELSPETGVSSSAGGGALGGSSSFSSDLYGGDPELQLLSRTADQLEELCVRREGEDVNIPFDSEAVGALTDTISELMGGLCTEYGYTREMLDEKSLPAAFFKELPGK